MFTNNRKNRIKRLIKQNRAPHSARIKVWAVVKEPIALKVYCLLSVCSALSAFLMIMNTLRTDSQIAEWWTTHIQAAWEVFIGAVTSIFPFSVFELCIVLLILFGIYLLVRFFVDLYGGKFKRIAVGAVSLCLCGLVVLDLYILSMGFGYYRYEMPLPQAGSDYTAEQAAVVAEYFLDDYNELARKLKRDETGNMICPYSTRELGKIMVDEYARIDDGYMLKYTPVVKPIVNSWLLSDMLIIGITFLPTGEANVNIDAPASQVTATVAHELAHTKGIQREGDANLISQYVLLTSENEYLRYCGYYDAFNHLLSALMLAGDIESYSKLASKIDPLIATERRNATEYWNAQPDITGKLSEFFNNMYLKSNGAGNGTGSYSDGEKTDVIKPTDPITGEPEVDPDTGEPVIIPIYSSLQKLFFYLYELKCGTPLSTAVA